MPKLPITVVLDNVRSGLNIGSVFRTMDAFRLDHLVLCGICASPPHKEIAKSAIGAEQSVSWSYHQNTESALRKLKSTHYIIGVEQTTSSQTLHDYRCDQSRLAIVFGNEVQGISEEAMPLVDDFIEIEQFGTKHSLNVSVCAGIVLWKLAQPFIQKMQLRHP